MTPDDSYIVRVAACEAFAIQADVERERLRPFILLKPKMFFSRNKIMWCALYGDSFFDGVYAYGDTPEQAAIQFDIKWLNGSNISGNNHD